MVRETCELCRQKSPPGTVAIYYIVPQDVAMLAGLPCPRTVTLCDRCQKELRGWYSRKVLDVTYDPGTKRFTPRSPEDMVAEYEAAYKAFASYKERTRQTSTTT